MQLPTSAGLHWDSVAVPESDRPKDGGLTGWIDSLEGDDEWLGPDDEPTGRPLEVTAARDIYNSVSKQTRQGGSEVVYNLSIHSPNTFHLKSTIGQQLVQWGANVIEFDGAVVAGRIYQGDFSEWAIQDFQDWLGSLPADRLDQLGIERPKTFNIRSYAQSLLESVQAGEKPQEAVVEDGVLYEFFLMEHKHILTFYERFSEAVKASGDTVNSPVNVLANQGDAVIHTRGAASVILSQAFDAIEIEGPITMPGQPERWNPYRTDIRTPRHKLAAARARVTGKPPVEHGFYRKTGSERDLEAGRQYPVLQTLNFAETYANGSRRQLDITGWADQNLDDISLFWWDSETGVPDPLQELADFLWTHTEALRGNPNSDIGIVYSLPSLLAKARRVFGRSLAAERKSLYGFVRALREAQLPSDILIFGHPTVWDDASTLDRLTDYDLLLVPGVTALTDAQVEHLRSFLQSGGRIIHEDSFATRDGRYRRRDRNPFSEYRDRIYATDGAARDIVPEGDPAAVIEAIQDGLPSQQVRIDEDYPLTVEVTSRGSQQVIHLLNYAYDLNSDTTEPFTEVEVSVRAPDFEVNRVYTDAPSGEYEELDFREDSGRVILTVPRIEVWTLVVLDGTSPEADQGEAAALETASTLITKANQEGRPIGLIDAEAALREAKLADDAGQPERAQSRAERAISLAERAYDIPRIGIDSGHGQRDGHSFAALNAFRMAMRDELTVEFVEVTDFAEATLRTLDALIIGQPIEEGTAFNLSKREIQNLKRFVRAGGGIGIFAHPYRRPISDLNRLASAFGVEIDFRPLHNEGHPESYFVPIDVPTFRTPLTYQVNHLNNINRACSLEVQDQTVEVAVTTEESVYREGAPSETAAFPILIGTKEGDGRVTCSTNSRMLTQPESIARVLDRNILHWISSPGQPQTLSDTTPTPTNPKTSSPAPTSTVTHSTTTGDQGPGFGVWTTLAGVGTALRYLRYRQRSTDSDRTS